MCEEDLPMIAASLRAAHALIHYSELDEQIGAMLESTHVVADVLSSATATDRKNFSTCIPVLHGCRRRLLALAAAMGRLERVIAIDRV